jgi:hypothetical protein
MIQNKKLLLAVAIFCACSMSARAAEIEWTATSGTIPNDGNTYYIIKLITTTGTLTNNGTLEIRSGGHLSSGANINNNATTTIKTGGQISLNGNNFSNDSTLNISGGTFHLISGEFRSLNAIGPVYVNVTAGLLKISGGTFYNGYLTPGGTAYVTVSSNGTLELAGGTFSNADSINSIGYLTISSPAQFVMGGGTLQSGAGTSYIDIFGNSFTITSGTLTNGGTFTLPSGSIFSIGSGGTFINNSTLDVIGDASLNVAGDLKNRSSSSVNIYGNVYTYSYLENGDTGNAGTINIDYPGKLFLLSGLLKNANSGSAINVNSGGKILNYYGKVDTVLGTITTSTGSLFDNVRGANPGTVTDDGGIIFDGNKITLIDNIDLDSTWTITEKATLNCDGHKVIFGVNGAIVIDGADASLLIKNASVEKVSGNQIRCTENTTTLSIDGVTWIQDSNYSFTKGTLSINGKWLVSGANTAFTYNSNQQSIIQQNGELIFDRDVTFTYASSTLTNLAMIDGTSILHLGGATLGADEDLRLTKGKIIFDDNTTFNIATGKTVYFGNSSAPDNVTLRFDTDSQLNLLFF